MHDDPTRIMGQPGDPDRRPRGNMRLLVAGLIAGIVGLVGARGVIAFHTAGAGTTCRAAATHAPPTTRTTESSGEETTPEPTTTESTETTESTTTETTEPTTAPP